MTPLSKILLVYDGTGEAQAALVRCSQLAVAFSSQVDVVSVVDTVSANAICAGLLTDLACHGLEEHARQAIASAVTQLADRGVAAHGHIRFGRTGDVVSRHVAMFNTDFVVVGHRALRGMARWWSERPVHLELADRLRGPTILTVTLPSA